MKKNYRKRIFEIIQIANGSDFLSRTFDICIISLIILSIAVTFFQSFRLNSNLMHILSLADAICMIVFSIEYILRLSTADLLYPNSNHPHLRYIRSADAVIDLLSILPFYLSGFVPPGIVVFRLIRVARILKLFRINKYSDPITLIIAVVKKKASQLLASLFLVMVLMLASSILMYYAEHDTQPEVFDSAFSGIWWAVATLSTTGYGDIYPVTTLGKIIAMLITLLGMFVVAIPTGILTAGFMESVGNTAISSENDISADNYRILDISREIYSCPVYPGDPEPSHRKVKAIVNGAKCNVSEIKLGSHSATHMDAPYHFYEDGNTIEQVSLSRCLGRCVVETVEGEISPELIGDIESRTSAAAAKRLLFRGRCQITREAAEYMNELGVILVGVEANTVGDKDIHYELLKKNMVILETLDLSEVEDGEYFLMSLPLKLGGSDGSPVRAVLLSV